VDDATLDRRRRRTQQAFYRLFGGVERDGGVFAAVAPETPNRSLFNAVTYDDPRAVIAARDELAGVYAEAGVRAWTVWVHPGDRELAEALRDAGHRLDGTPEGMACELAALDLEGEDVSVEPSWQEFVAINAAAYRVPSAELSALATLPDGSIRRYGVPGRAVVGALDCDGDCGITMVATRPSAQRRGLCDALMRQALREARERGCETATLDATQAGRPVYARLGFRALGPQEMWEHRV
jgi:ribosomal protein S18 acetylase RimI-like enzyme